MSAAGFPPNSRYAAVKTMTLDLPDGTTIVCLERRFVPPPERFALVRTHVVKEHERLDRIAARHLGDPELFWRLCDANRAMRPEDLEDLGTVLRITGPEGLPGTAHA